MAGTNLYWGHGEDALRELVERRGIPVFLNGLARGCIPADHELFFSRARSTALKGADVALVVGVPMDFRLGFGKSFGDDTEIVAIDVAEPERDHPRAPAAELYGDVAAILSGLAEGVVGADTREWVETHPRGGAREARGRARAARGPARAAAPDAAVRGAGRGARPQRDRDRRRRRLRLLRRPRDRLLRAGLLARPGPVRLPRLRPRLRAGRQARAPRPPGRAAARRRRLRLLRDGVRHARAPRRQRRRRDGQQRDLGAREAPDGVPLRLLRGRRPAAGDALRPGRRGARRPRRAGARARGVPGRDGAGVRGGQAGAGERPHRSVGRVPALVQPGGARDVHDRRRLAGAPRPAGGGDAAAARRDILGRPACLELASAAACG